MLSYPSLKAEVILHCSVTVIHQLFHYKMKVIKMFAVVTLPSYIKCSFGAELCIPTSLSIADSELKLLNLKQAVSSRPCPPTKLLQQFYFSTNCVIINVIIVLT